MSLDFKELSEKTIQSQYGASPHITGIIDSSQKQLDPTQDIETFYDEVFNPKTAEGVGLDIWGRIVGANRYLTVDSEDVFGFDGSYLLPFDQAPFTGEGATNRYRMTDPAYRDLVFLKAAANIGNATLPSIKSILSTLFDKPVYVFNVAPMKVRVVFTFYLTVYQVALLKTYGILNLGAGVDWEFYQVEDDATFGFSGSELQPFGQGVFQPYGIQTP